MDSHPYFVYILKKQECPEYVGFGSPEDTLASCLHIVPRKPKKDIARYLKNANKFLRFGCVLDNAHPEDKRRQFILKFSLFDGTIAINELPLPNSGFKSGKFLKPQLIAKPDSSIPEYYSYNDFSIGE